MLTIGLFLSLLCLLLLLTITTRHSASPAAKTIDAARQKIRDQLTRGHRATRLAVMAKHSREVVNTALGIGIGTGLLALLVGWVLIGPWALILSVFAAVGGILLVDVLLANEYRQLQARMFEGVPVLIDFVPAFLAVGTITPREAMKHTLAFLPEPFKSEMWAVTDRIARTGNPKEAFSSLRERLQHPAVDALCLRLSSVWDTRVSPDVFDDLSDLVTEIKEMAATRATAAKGGFLALVLLMGLLTGMLLIGYPGLQWVLLEIGGQFS